MIDRDGIDIAFWETMLRSDDNRSLVYVANFDNVRKQAYIRFMYWKISQAMFVDPSYDETERDTRNWVPRGGYHYVVGNKDGRDQALFYLDKVSKFDVDLPHMADFEHKGSATFKQVGIVAEKFIRTIHDQTNTFPLIYTAAWFWNSMPNVNGASQCELCVADYSNSADPLLPRNGPWKKALIRQNDVKKTVPGLVGGVDHNKFLGTEEDFKRFTNNWSFPPPTTEFPKKAICIVRSLWIRDKPGGSGIGGLKYGDAVIAYEEVVAANHAWIRISESESKWCALRRLLLPMSFMRYI